MDRRLQRPRRVSARPGCDQAQATGQRRRAAGRDPERDLALASILSRKSPRAFESRHGAATAIGADPAISPNPLPQSDGRQPRMKSRLVSSRCGCTVLFFLVDYPERLLLPWLV